MLSRKGVKFREREFFRERFTEEELRDLVRGRAVREFFSWKSPSLKALGLAGRELSDDEMLRYILQEPRLIRRPIIRVGDQTVIGCNEEQLDRLLRE